MLPKIAEGDANKVWIVPSEIGKALEGLGSVDRTRSPGIPQETDGPRDAGRHGDRSSRPRPSADASLSSAHEEVPRRSRAAEESRRVGGRCGRRATRGHADRHSARPRGTARRRASGDPT